MIRLPVHQVSSSLLILTLSWLLWCVEKSLINKTLKKYTDQVPVPFPPGEWDDESEKWIKKRGKTFEKKIEKVYSHDCFQMEQENIFFDINLLFKQSESERERKIVIAMSIAWNGHKEKENGIFTQFSNIIV